MACAVRGLYWNCADDDAAARPAIKVVGRAVRGQVVCSDVSETLAGWLGSAGAGCIQSFVRLGPQALSPEHDLSCFPFIVLLGTFPATVMAAMLRRGAPLTPHLTTALGGLAAAGLANFSLRLFHPEDITIMLLVWHIGGVFALSALAAVAGRYLMNWRSITSASQSAAQ